MFSGLAMKVPTKNGLGCSPRSWSMPKKPYRTSTRDIRTNLAHGLYRNLVSFILILIVFSYFSHFSCFHSGYATPNSDPISSSIQSKQQLSTPYSFPSPFPKARHHPTPKSYPAGLLEQVWGPWFQEQEVRWRATPRDGHAPIDS